MKVLALYLLKLSLGVWSTECTGLQALNAHTWTYNYIVIPSEREANLCHSPSPLKFHSLPNIAFKHSWFTKDSRKISFSEEQSIHFGKGASNCTEDSCKRDYTNNIFDAEFYTERIFANFHP